VLLIKLHKIYVVEDPNRDTSNLLWPSFLLEGEKVWVLSYITKTKEIRQWPMDVEVLGRGNVIEAKISEVPESFLRDIIIYESER